MAAEKKPPSLAKIALAGGWAGSMEILVTYPLEFAKTHLQLQHGAAGTKSGFDRGVVHCLASTVERHGVRGVYAVHVAQHRALRAVLARPARGPGAAQRSSFRRNTKEPGQQKSAAVAVEGCSRFWEEARSCF